MVVDSQLLITRFVDPMQPNAIAIWCPSAVCDDALAYLTRALQIRRLVERGLKPKPTG